MEQVILDFFKKYQLDKSNTRVLIACSGGMDSMALAHLFLRSKISFGIAHMDHTTREGESYQDRLFVEQFAAKHQLEFHVHTIDIEKEKSKSKDSFQMIARRLRYDFLHKVRQDNQYDYIATAHHQDDNVETFLINLSRAQGVTGLSGINEKSDFIIRPLLGATREQIRTFVYSNKIEFREDSTNLTNKFQRNTWRRTLLPYIHKHYPSFSSNIAKSIDYLAQADAFIDDAVHAWTEKYIEPTDDGFQIPLKPLQEHHHPSFLLLKILQPYGFNHAQVVDALSFQSVGKSCESNEYILRLERDYFDIIKKKASPTQNIAIAVYDGLKVDGLGVFRIKEATDEGDTDGILIPKDWCTELAIRHWQAGDRFKPVGMQGKSKKLKKFFVDEKYSTSEKNNQWLLTYKDQVIWIIGRRKAIVPTSSDSVLITIEK